MRSSHSRRALWIGVVAVALAAAGCGSTVDSLGYDEPPEPPDPFLRPLTPPSSYPNPLGDLMGLGDEEIDTRLENAFQRLFHGDPDTEAIYRPVGEDQAYIEDVLHGDIRTEGIGYAMMICVQLDRREEFDALWRYARANLEYAVPPKRGYFVSSCDYTGGPRPCDDPFGPQQFLMSLIFAHGRWGSDSGGIDYEADALALLDVFRNKEVENEGIVEGVTNMFDAETGHVPDVPNVYAAGYTRPSIEMPAYYGLWAQATDDEFWSLAATAARDHWVASAHPTTGLWPLRADFGGAPLVGSDTFVPECYRTQLSLVLDRIWLGTDDRQVEQADRLLAFFLAQGSGGSATSYTLEGAVIDGLPEASLVLANGATAVVSTLPERADFIDAAWRIVPPDGTPRYYTGLMQILSLLAMSGRYRVY